MYKIKNIVCCQYHTSIVLTVEIFFADYYDDFFGYEDYDYYGGGYAPQMPRGRGGRGGPPVSI